MEIDYILLDYILYLHHTSFLYQLEETHLLVMPMQKQAMHPNWFVEARLKVFALH